jgi:AI-2 transport protein TqsA
MGRIVKFTASLILVWIIGYLLIVGRNVLIPFIMAIFVWNLLNTLNEGMQRMPVVGVHIPYWLSMIFSLVLVTGFSLVLVNIITNNVSDVIGATSRYEDNLARIFSGINERYHLKSFVNTDVLLKNLNLQSILVNLYGVFTALMSSALLIALYVVFLFIEQHFFKQKLDAMFSQKAHRALVDKILSHIVKDTQTYLGLKTLSGVITALASWLIMRWVHLDFAEFWALLIFFLNYIPNIGAIIATAFPALLALVQFESWVPFAIISSGIVTVQFVIGNLVEPRFMGKSLNLSPLVILFMLGIWGLVWGILGMFLSVPITVMMMIIFSHFDSTRPIAILLSQDGQIKTRA